VPALAFDGRTLRLVRRAEGGRAAGAWWLRTATGWQRWASPGDHPRGDLQQAWLRSQQAAGDTPGILRCSKAPPAGRSDLHTAAMRTNCQSSGDLVATAPPAAGASVTGAARTSEQLPSGLRLVLQFDGQTLTRDVAVAPAL
jgi:general secretion pathway protein J